MATRLHHDRVAGPQARRWLVMTHGIYGAGGNWRAIARRISDARPEWGIALVDLRGHGRSDHGESPHTIEACAADVAALIRELGELGDVCAMSGHSFGGKVALATRARAELAQTWLLDASWSPRPDAATDPDNTVARVLAVMERLPRTWSRRDDFVAAIIADGHPATLGSWLAMNLVPDAAGRLALRLDLAQMHELLASYYATDLWAELSDPTRGDVELVIADRSTTVSAEDRAQLATAPAHVHGHHVEAGHWLHLDAPAAIVELFVRLLA
jgi:esterase